MFSKKELEWIEIQAKEFSANQEMMLGDLLVQEDPYHQLVEDMAGCVSGMEFADRIALKAGMLVDEHVECKYIPMDADHTGELCGLCFELWTAWRDDSKNLLAGKSCGEIMERTYKLGCIEGRLLSGRVTKEDLDTLETWKEEMEEN